MPTPTEIVTAFCAAFDRRDVDEVMTYFAPDPVYHNMPGPPLVGTEAVRAGISRFLSAWSATHWDILNIAANGNVVFTERVDRIDSAGKHLDLPVAGVFEVTPEGKISAWRDYFDLATYTRTFQ